MMTPEDMKHAANMGRAVLRISTHAQMVNNDISFMRDTPVKQLRSWFLESFTSNDYSPVHMCDDPSAPRQLSGLYKDLDSEIQLKMRTALTGAVADWKPNEHGNKALSEMAYTAVEIKAGGAVPHLIKVIDDRQIVGDPGKDEEVGHAWRSVVGGVGGFAPTAEIEQASRRWLYDSTFPPRFLAQVMSTLTLCTPDEYPAHVSRFLEVEKQHSDYYSLDAVLGNVVRHAGVQTVAEHMHEFAADPLLIFTRAVKRDFYKRAELLSDLSGLRDRRSDQVHAFKPQQQVQRISLEQVVAQVLAEPAKNPN